MRLRTPCCHRTICRSDENLKLKKSPYRGSHYRGSREPIVRRRLELIRFGWRRGSACSRKNTKQIHLRGFFSSITPHVAAAVIPPSATSSKTSSGVPIGVIRHE